MYTKFHDSSYRVNNDRLVRKVESKSEVIMHCSIALELNSQPTRAKVTEYRFDRKTIKDLSQADLDKYIHTENMKVRTCHKNAQKYNNKPFL